MEKATIEIDGKKYRLGYDFNVIVDVEMESGGNLLDGLLNPGGLNAAQLRGLLCAAIRTGTPATKKKQAITVKQVGALLDYNNIVPLSEALSKSILLSFAPTEQPVLSDPPPPAPDEDEDGEDEDNPSTESQTL